MSSACDPLHAAKVGGLLYKLALTLVGLVLTLLGSLAVWSFWRFEIKKPRAKRKTAPPVMSSPE